MGDFFVEENVQLTTGETIFSLVLLLLLCSIPLIFHYRQKRIQMKNEETGRIIEVPFLYSWTSALFGPLVPIARKDIMWFIYYLASYLLTYGLASAVLSFYYNRVYLKRLITQGYIPNNELSEELLISKDLYTKTNWIYGGVVSP